MAISFVQINNVGYSSTAIGSQALSFSSAITAGSIILVAGNIDSRTCASVTIDDGHGDSVTDSGQGLMTRPGSFPCISYIKAFFAPTGGTQTITQTFSGGTNGTALYCDLYIYEVAGLTSAKFDRVVAANSVTSGGAAASGTTGTLSTAAEAAISIINTDGACSATPGATWSTGQGSTVGTNIGDGVAANTGDLGQHQVTAATTALNGTNSLGSAGNWTAWAATVQSGSGTAWTDNATLAGVGLWSPSANTRFIGQSTFTGAGRISGPSATFDPTFVNASITLTGNNLVVTGVAASANTSARTTVSASAGKLFCEFSANNIAGQSGVGICNASQGAGTSLAASLNAVGYMADGTVRINSSTVSTLLSFTTGDIIDMAVDFDNSRIWFRKNNGLWNNSAAANPGGNVGGISISTLNAGPYFAAVEVVGTDKITAAFHGN